MADGGEGAGREETPQKGTVAEGHIHAGMPFHATGDSLLRLLSRRRHQLGAEREVEEEGQKDDHQDAASKLGHQELPAEQDQQHQAQFKDQVGGGKLEDDGVGEARLLAEQRARHGDRCIGTGGGRRAN